MKRFLDIIQVLFWILGATFLILSLLNLSQSSNLAILGLNDWLVKILKVEHPLRLYLPIALMFITLSNAMNLVKFKFFPKVQNS